MVTCAAGDELHRVVRKRVNSSYSVCMPSPEDWCSGCCRAVRDVCCVCSVVLTVWRPCARKTGRSLDSGPLPVWVQRVVRGDHSASWEYP